MEIAEVVDGKNKVASRYTNEVHRSWDDARKLLGMHQGSDKEYKDEHDQEDDVWTSKGSFYSRAHRTHQHDRHDDGVARAKYSCYGDLSRWFCVGARYNEQDWRNQRNSVRANDRRLENDGERSRHHKKYRGGT